MAANRTCASCGRQERTSASPAPDSGSRFSPAKGRYGPACLSNGGAADVLWLLMSPDQYYRLVHRRRWTKQKHQRRLAASITQLLFADHPEPP